MSEFLEHTSCSKCGSSDANAVYADGGTHCFSCGEHTFPDKPNSEVIDPNLLQGTFQTLTKRHISKETCSVMGYLVCPYYEFRDDSGTVIYKGPVQVANYYKDTRLVAQKIRTPNKDFCWLGDSKAANLFGMQLWGKGKMIVVTEGEIDALSVSQVQGNQWPVISLKNGSSSAAKAIKENYDYFNGFEKVVLMFDMDEPGQEAAIEAAKLLPPGKAFIASLPVKDANEMLVAGNVKELVNAIWQAKRYRPDGIMFGEEVYKRMLTRDYNPDFHYPWPILDKLTGGIRKREIAVFAAGTGMGKSTMVAEVGYSLLTANNKVAFLALEEDIEGIAMGLVGLSANKRFMVSPELINDSEIKQHFDSLLGNNAVFYDHVGNLDEDRLLEVIRYLKIVNGCEYIFLDHISMACTVNKGDDERKVIDMTMTKLKKLAIELNIAMFIVTHLNRPDGAIGHEDGLEVKMKHIRGSGSIGQIGNVVIGLQSKKDSPNFRQLVLLKNRHSGMKQEADEVVYDQRTGHLLPKYGQIVKSEFE